MAYLKGEPISKSRIKRQERGIWQRRFWAYWIVNQNDFNNHVDYIHWNSVKHGHVKNVRDWYYSSFHYYVASGLYAKNWGAFGKIYY